MELGCDGVLINTAIAKAKNPIQMAEAMKLAVISGRKSYHQGERINLKPFELLNEKIVVNPLINIKKHNGR